MRLNQNITLDLILIDWKENPLPEELPESLAKKIKEDFKYKIKTIHNVYEYDQIVGETNFEIRMESTGTQNFLIAPVSAKGNFFLVRPLYNGQFPIFIFRAFNAYIQPG